MRMSEAAAMTLVAVESRAGVLARLWRGLQSLQEHQARRIIGAHRRLVAEAPLLHWDEAPARATPGQTWNAVLTGTTCEAGLRTSR
jgi:hypothetical protein